MKKTFVRLGVLAAALVFAFVFASCAQPTDESSSGPNAPTIIRLHLDKQETTAFVGTTFEIRVGEELYVPQGVINYPYANVPGQNDGKTSGQQINTVDINDRTRVLAIPGTVTRTDDPNESVLQREGKKNILASGVLNASTGVGAVGSGTTGAGLIQTDNKDKTQRYIDIELVDVKQSSAGFGSVFSGSISGYVELAVTGTVAGNGLAANRAYLYTKDKHGFNDFLRLATAADATALGVNAGTPIYGVKNANIKKVSLKSGINDLYLSFFSFNQDSE
ncbi:MAG: hypothetical protein LBK62_10275 [Treponema sp.]|jgi:hypothetical protein|nr:hypothetical protein [Treponema sp.]